MNKKNLDICSNLVRTFDYENYLCALFSPKEVRSCFFAIRAFNVEVAGIREKISDPNIGLMKIQWWKDQISNTFKGKPPNHHVTLLLAESLETSNLSINWFNRILNERAENLNDPQYNTLEELENYAENTSSSLLYLQLEALGLKNVTTDHVASHIGKAVGISTIIRATPYHVRERRFYLPTQIAAKFKLSTESVFRTGPSSELSDVVFDVATCANDHLITARSQAPKLSKQAIPGLLNIVPANSFLVELEKHNFNIYNPKLHKRNWKIPFQIWNTYRKLEL